MTDDYYLYQDIMGPYEALVSKTTEAYKTKFEFLEIFEELTIKGGTYTKIRGLEGMTHLLKVEYQQYSNLLYKIDGDNPTEEDHKNFEESNRLLKKILDWWFINLETFSNEKVLTTFHIFYRTQGHTFQSKNDFISTHLQKIHKKLLEEVPVYKKLEDEYVELG